MKIIVSQQQGKKLLITFESGKTVDKYVVDKTEVFLVAVDKFIKKRKIRIESLEKANLKFINTGMLTERIVRSIMAGLSFHPAGDPLKGDMLKFRPKF